MDDLSFGKYSYCTRLTGPCDGILPIFVEATHHLLLFVLLPPKEGNFSSSSSMCPMRLLDQNVKVSLMNSYPAHSKIIFVLTTMRTTGYCLTCKFLKGSLSLMISPEREGADVSLGSILAIYSLVVVIRPRDTSAPSCPGEIQVQD